MALQTCRIILWIVWLGSIGIIGAATVDAGFGVLVEVRREAPGVGPSGEYPVGSRPAQAALSAQVFKCRKSRVTPDCGLGDRRRRCHHSCC